MLTGFYREGEHIVNISGYDMGETFVFYASCPMVRDRKFLDKGILIEDVEGGDEYYPPSWENLYVSISSASVSVSCFTKTEGSTVYKNQINAGFFKRLGSLMRGMKLNCFTSNRDDALDISMGVFSPRKELSYTIPNKSGGTLGSVVMSMCSVVGMRVGDSSSNIELVLEEDYTHTLKINKLTRTHHKIKLDLSEYLLENNDDGWDVDDLSSEVFTLQDIIERNPQKNYVWLNDRKYHIVSDIAEVERVCKKIWNHKGVVCFDTETTGLDITFKSRQGIGDRLVGMVFSIEEGEAWYFPIAHKNIKNICNRFNENFIIEKYFKPLLERKKILAHSGSFDWKVMYIYGIFLNLVHDTLILFKLSYWNDNRGLELGLKSLTNTFLHRDSFELHDFVSGRWGINDVKFWDLPYESVKYYACPDTDNTLSLYNYAVENNIFDLYGMRKTYEIEVAFSLCIAYQEFYGHCADMSRTDQLAKDIKDNLAREYKAMVEIVGHDFNPRSSKELPVVLFEELGCPIIKRTDTGNPSTDKSVLKKLEGITDAEDNPLYPIISHLRKWKESAQLESNFINNLGKLATEDGFMFSKVQQFLETGRVSVNSPNYQSYNDVVKKYIIPRDGFYALDTDYSSIEYRILASMAGQDKLIEDFKDPDVDYHAYQASRMFNVPYELVTKTLRSQAKGINFGLPYGMGDAKLGESIFGSRTPENTRKAKKLRKLYFEGQEKIEQFFIEARRNGVEKSYSDTFFGRRRYFDKRVKDKGSIERESGNNRIQGTAADIYKIAMVRLFAEIRKRGWLGLVLLSAFVHDEAFIEVHKSINPAVMLKVLRKALMLDIPGWCPLYIGAGFGTNWYDAKKTEIPVQVQDIIVDNWGDTGLDWWDGDTDRLFNWEVSMINSYKKDRVLNFIKNEENWGKVLPPVENGFAHEVLDEICSGRPVEGVVIKDIKSDKDTLQNLENFCKVFGYDELFKKADIQPPNLSTPDSNSGIDDDMDEEEEKVDLFALTMSKVNTMGVGLDNIGNKLYFRFDENDSTLMGVLHSIISRNPGNYEVLAVKNGNELFRTGLSVSLVAYRDILSAYMSRKNQRGV